MQVIDGELLGRTIKVKKHSLRGFADKMGWKSHTYLQRLIRGEVRSVTPETAALMCHYLEVPLDLLFETKVSTNSGQSVDENGRKKAS